MFKYPPPFIDSSLTYQQAAVVSHFFGNNWNTTSIAGLYWIGCNGMQVLITGTEVTICRCISIEQFTYEFPDSIERYLINRFDLETERYGLGQLIFRHLM